MAKHTSTTIVPSKVVSSAPLLPKTTDPRAELFFYLGHLKGLGIESAARITELVIDLTSPAAEASATEVE